MADNAIALQVNPNAGIDTYTKLLGLQQSRLGVQQAQQNLDTGQYQQQQQQAAAIKSQQEARETQAGTALLSDPVAHGLVDQDGNPTANAYNIIMRTMPMTGSAHFQNIVGAAKSKIDFNSAALGLNDAQRGVVSSTGASVAANPESTAIDYGTGMQALRDSVKGTPNATHVNTLADIQDKAVTQARQQYPDGQNGVLSPQVRHLIQGFSRATLSPQNLTGSGGVGTVQSGTIDQGGQIQPVAIDRTTGTTTPTGPAYSKGLAPNVYQDSAGVFHQMGGAAGGFPGAQASGQQPGQMTPGAPPPGQQPSAGRQLPQTLPPKNWNDAVATRNYQTTMVGNTDHYRAVSGAVTDPQNGVEAVRWRNNELLRLVDPKGGASTGPGRAFLNGMASLVPGVSGDDYQKAGHFLAQNTAAISKTMGVPNTDAGAAAAGSAAGNLAQNPGALTEITKVNDATNTALAMYNRGLAVLTNNGSDLTRVAAYRQTFGQNFDLNYFRMEDAIRRGDKSEVDSLTKKLGSDGLAKLGKTRRLMQSLSNTGTLPQ